MIVTEDEDVKDDYKPEAISITTVEAFEDNEQKDEDKVLVHFDFPSNLRGDKISFRINYANEQEDDEVSLPLVLSKQSLPISFRIITVSIINDREYASSSDQIIISHPSLSLPSFVYSPYSL